MRIEGRVLLSKWCRKRGIGRTMFNDLNEKRRAGLYVSAKVQRRSSSWFGIATCLHRCAALPEHVFVHYDTNDQIDFRLCTSN